MRKSLNQIIDEIVESYDNHEIITKIDYESQPSRKIINEIVYKLQKIIFPGFFEEKNLKREYIKYYVGELCEDVEYNLTKQIVKAYRCCFEYQNMPDKQVKEQAENVTAQFMSTLPKIREYLDTDVQAAYEGDPAAYGMDEIICSYPGIFAIMTSRIAHELYCLNVPLVPRIMTEHAHNKTGIDIHPGASIGKYFFIDHGTGIVIGETTVIGEHVKIYQGVTLGGLSTSGGQNLKGTKRHPNIEDYVTIYSGASILGGDTTIGSGTVIGGNAFVTHSVSANTKVTVKNPELKFRQEG